MSILPHPFLDPAASDHRDSRPLIIGIGEILWDLFPEGPRMGGAPANFTCHAGALGAEAAMVSRVGDDEAGRGLLAALDKFGVSTSGISIDPTHATGAVSVEVLEDGQPHFTIHEDVAWDHLVVEEATLDMAKRAAAICYGTLAQRSNDTREAILGLLAAASPETLCVLDVNLRQEEISRTLLEDSLEHADILKLNDAELPRIAGIFGIEGSVRQMLTGLVSRFGLRLVAYTRGPQGSILHDGKEWSEHSGYPVDLRDTVGAGDSFLAAVTLGLLKGWPLDEISEAANLVAAHVCSQDGAVPPLPDHLRARFHDLPSSGQSSPQRAMATVTIPTNA